MRLGDRLAGYCRAVEPRTVGIEEELLLVDPETRQLSPRSEAALRHAVVDPEAAEDERLDKELFRHQLETRTTPLADLGEVRAHLVRQRRSAAQAAEGAGALTMASGTAPTGGDRAEIYRNDRYLAMLQTYGEIARLAGICGLHVHVGIDSDEQGVEVLDRIAPWLPVLLAISANSPYAGGHDTGYHSWRSQTWARWPSVGPAEHFGSVEGYREACRRLIAAGAARDEAMLYFDARLSPGNPTIEVRVSDVCTDPDDAVLIAALVRGLVMRIADGPAPTAEPPVWRAELLQAAKWRAARYGLSDRLLCPTDMEPAPAREVVASLVATVTDALTECGDLDLVTDGVARVLAGGGASRQHAAYERSGGDVHAVVDDLVARTNTCWQD
jgi:carboxylate-amine ligase